MKYWSASLIVCMALALAISATGQDSLADVPPVNVRTKAKDNSLPAKPTVRRPPAPSKRAKRPISPAVKTSAKRARRATKQGLSVNVLSRSKRPHYYLYNRTSLENRGPQAYQWQLKCPQGVQQNGQINSFETLYFQPRGTVLCRLQLQGQSRSIPLNKSASWILYQGQLYLSRSRTVIYPPVRPFGDVGLIKQAGYIRQWASSASASSQWSTSSYNAQQLVGPPNVNACQDSSNAWCPSKSDGGREWIKLTYAKRTNAIGVVIHANNKPGTVREVHAWDGNSWNTVWKGSDPTKGHCPGIFAIRFQHPIETKEIRIILDTKRVTGWNEIDAVQLISQP